MTHILPRGLKKFFFLSYFLCLLSNIKAQSCQDLMVLVSADSLFKAGNYAAAKNAHLKAVQGNYPKRLNYYYLAVCYGKLDQKDSACHYLSIGADRGLKYLQMDHFKGDSNLDPLRTAAAWPNVEKKIAANTAIKPSIDSSLLAELQRRKILDQQYRTLSKKTFSEAQLDSVWKIQKAIDLDNQRWLKKMMCKKGGWLSISKVGKEGEHIAWLFVQHADNNIKFQKRCLKKISRLIVKNEVDRKNYAYLKDRVLVNQDKKQLYGTQFQRIEQDNGGFVLKPKALENPSCVDARRAYMGLPSLATYLESASKYYQSKG